MNTQTITGIKFHNCTAKEFRIDGTYTVDATDYDFTIIYNNYNVPMEDDTFINWYDDKSPDNADEVEAAIREQFKAELDSLLKQAELTKTEHADEVQVFINQLTEGLGADESGDFTVNDELIAFIKNFRDEQKLKGRENEYDEWCDKFVPVKNHIDDNAAFDGCAFETYGEEVDYIINYNVEHPNNVWTVLDCDGHLYVSAGYHFVNRLNYFITEKEWTAEDEQKEYFIS